MKKKSTQFRWLVTMLLLVTAMVMPSISWASSYTDDFVGGRTDFRDEAIYSVLTTRFYDGDKSNNAYCFDHSTAKNGMDAEWRGDFKGLIEKLDYIKALGFTAVWISPVVENASGYDYHGYHPFDFTKEDARLQSKASAVLGIAEDVTFQTLVDEAHKRGMKIILDIVLNSTGNFGEKNLCQMFRKDYSSIYEGDLPSSLIPVTVNDTDDNGNPGKLPEDYWSLKPGDQYSTRLVYMKNTDNVNHDSHNYWHHWADLIWESFTEQTGQIVGDCIDLNTENPAVYKYLRESYGRFIEMGVDGFRIADVKHISRLTFNNAFLPYFHEMGEQYKSKRLNNCPFFIYGEVCARYNKVTYMNIPALSSYFYTWQSPETLTTQWDDDATFWDNKEIYGNTDVTAMGNIGLTYQEYTQAGSESDQPTSNNALLNGNEYHAPDASEASGMNVIDFPMHRLFGNATDAFGIAKSGDRLYNDATYNVVYVDSYDYGPEIYENTRFSGGADAWAENLNLMFTFRGIPCLLYGSEIEFRNDKILDIGTNGPLKETGRAYYGGYITGDVTATGFGSYSDANSNVAATLSKPLARHIARLSQIRQQVPALRKGQYSTEGCEGAIAFKRRYTNGDIDSYALVAISGAATFTGVLNGEYTEVITGTKVTVNDSTLSSPEITKGNMRVYVLNGTSKIGEDGPYLFDTTANHATEQTYDGHEEDDCAEKPEDCRPKFSPEAGLFDGKTLEVTITPTSRVVSAWYKVGEDGTKTDITLGTETKITIGEGIESGDIVIYYGYTGETGIETTRSVTYFKTGNEASNGITIYVKGEEAPNIYAWVEDESGSTTLTESWPGTKMTESTTINGENFWYHTISGYSSFNYIINNGSGTQTSNFIATGDRYHGDINTFWEDITEEVIKGSGGTDEPTPASHTYTVAGMREIVNGEDWNTASETNRMTSTDGVTYTLEVKNAVLTAGNYGYKVCVDGSLNVNPAGYDATLTIPADGTYDITYTYKVGDTEPSYSIKPSEGSNLVLFSAHYGLAGSEEKTELMLLKGSDGKWKSTIEGLTAGNYEVDVKGTDGSSYPEVPVSFNITIDNQPYEVSYDETTHDVIVNIAILNFTVAGSPEILNGVGWDPTSVINRMTSTDGVTYTLEVKNAELTAGNYQYKVCKDGNWIVTYPAVNNATLTIPADGTYDITYTYKVGDTEPSAEATMSEITLAANSGSTDYWGTYSNMSSAARLSTVGGTSLKVYDAKVSGGVLTLTERTGSDVAKGEGVLVWSNGATVRATVINDNLNASANTDLVATPATEQTISAGDGYTLYRLTYNNVSTKTGLGFYLGLVKDANGTVISDDGKKLKATPGKAYLKVSTEAATKPSNAAPARGFAFPGDDDTTGIGEIVIEGDAGISGSANADGRIYNLQGQQVTAPVKGLYIKNNKKVVIK